jgi:hypothetical protein
MDQQISIAIYKFFNLGLIILNQSGGMNAKIMHEGYPKGSCGLFFLFSNT